MDYYIWSVIERVRLTSRDIPTWYLSRSLSRRHSLIY